MRPRMQARQFWRTFSQAVENFCTLAASLLPQSSSDCPSDMTLASEATRLDVRRTSRVVCDERFAPSVAFGLEAKRLGAEVVRTHGDITDFWFEDLSRRWKEQPVGISGLTTHGPIFCLERFAWDHGLRVVFRGEHRVLSSGAIAHSITGRPDIVTRIDRSALDSLEWARHLTHVVIACEACQQRSAVATITSGSTVLADSSEPLVSWVIAPAC